MAKNKTASRRTEQIRPGAKKRKPLGQKYFPNGIAAMLRAVSDLEHQTEVDFCGSILPHLQSLGREYNAAHGLRANTNAQSLKQWINKRHNNKAALDFQMLTLYGKAAKCHNIFLQLLAQMASMEAYREGDNSTSKEEFFAFLDGIIALANHYKKLVKSGTGDGVFIPKEALDNGEIELRSDRLKETIEIFQERRGEEKWDLARWV